MRNLLRKVFLWLGAFFWSRRFRISSVVASSFALQAFACTYGTDESCDEDCYNKPPLECEPVYDEASPDSSLIGYRCGDSYETISVEEGEKRLQEL